MFLIVVLVKKSVLEKVFLFTTCLFVFLKKFFHEDDIYNTLGVSEQGSEYELIFHYMLF